MNLIQDSLITISQNENCKICYEIHNKSNTFYELIFNTKGFSTAENESVDLPFIGLADFRIFKNDEFIIGEAGSIPYSKSTINKIEPSEAELKDFGIKNNVKSKETYDLRLLYKISKNVISFRPNETKKFCTKINLPYYISPEDVSPKFYELNPNDKYEIQLNLQLPSAYIKELQKLLKKSAIKYNLYSGIITSSKINFQYIE